MTELQTPGIRSSLLPAAQISERSSGKSFNSPNAIGVLKKREGGRRRLAATQTTRTSPRKVATGPARPSRGTKSPPARRQRGSLKDSARPEPTREVVPRQEAADDDSFRPQGPDEDEEAYDTAYVEPRPAVMSSAEVLRGYARQQVEKDKENRGDANPDRPRPRSFIERQAHAVRVPSIDEDLGPTQASRLTAARKSTRSSKRSRGTELEEVSEDEGFEQDDRPINSNMRRAKPVAARLSAEASAPSPSKRRRREERPFTSSAASGRGRDEEEVEEEEEEEEAEEEAEVEGHRASAPLQPARAATHNARANSGLGAQESGRDAPNNLFTQVNELAKQVVATRAPHKVQTRRGWSAESVSRFVEYVEDNRYGTAWSKIAKQRDPLLDGRDQVALKDKARNMKLDFLKAGTELPVNFERIRLSKLQIEKLRALGIEYHQDDGRDV